MAFQAYAQRFETKEERQKKLFQTGLSEINNGGQRKNTKRKPNPLGIR